MAQCSAHAAFDFHPQLPIRVDFDAPDISSDGGALLLRPVDDRLGLTAGLAACLSDPRDPSRVLHDRQEQVRQRVSTVCAGCALSALNSPWLPTPQPISDSDTLAQHRNPRSRSLHTPRAERHK